MKKNLLPLIFIIVVVLMAPILAQGQYGPATQCTTTEMALNDFTGINCPTVVTGGTACKFNDPDEDCAMCCAVNTILKATNWMFVGIMAVSAVMVTLGAYFILTAGGNADQVTKGRDYLKYAIIGFVVAILANSIPALVRNVLGM